MRQKPYRPSNDVSQAFDDGVLTVYSIADAAEPGYKPVLQMMEKVKLRYSERRLGIQRYYSAMQNQIRIDRVVRVQNHGRITNQDAVQTEDGIWYRVDMVQRVEEVFPECVDITLVRFTQGEEARICGGTNVV